MILCTVAVILGFPGIILGNHQPLSTSADRDSQLEHGRQQLDLVRSHSVLPKYGSCWKRALEELEQGCKQLTDEEQSYLALQFANCFLERSGMETYPCKRGDDISNCLVNMDNNAFTSYSNFFTVSIT